MNPQKLSELEKLAREATKGEWENNGGFVRSRLPQEYVGDSIKITLSTTWIAETVRGEGYIKGNKNAYFIAAANPQTVLALIERVRELEEKIENIY